MKLSVNALPSYHNIGTSAVSQSFPRLTCWHRLLLVGHLGSSTIRWWPQHRILQRDSEIQEEERRHPRGSDPSCHFESALVLPPFCRLIWGFHCVRLLLDMKMAQLATHPVQGLVADNDQELFELVNERDEVIGTELRSVCHSKGLLHRAVYCWVFNGAGRLLLQRRSPAKKIGPGQWDLSVAEHLQPGESYLQVRWRTRRAALHCSRRGTRSRLLCPIALLPVAHRTLSTASPPHKRSRSLPSLYRQGVVRGLQEELGIAVSYAAVRGPLAPTHRRELHQGAFHDVELVQSFRWQGAQGGHAVRCVLVRCLACALWHGSHAGLRLLCASIAAGLRALRGTPGGPLSQLPSPAFIAGWTALRGSCR